MPVHAPPDTAAALGHGLVPKCDSRSLFQRRFADPQAKEDDRKEWFHSLIGDNRKATRPPLSKWLPAKAVTVNARLMSRLMVDLSGGVMENSHVNLDRYGLPVVPGSAVKGCGRRMALQALHDWVAAGTERPAPDDACAPCCEGFNRPADMLAAVAAVFGWVGKDWTAGVKEGRYVSDFGWACGKSHEIIWKEAAMLLSARFHWTLPAGRPWLALPSFAGTIAFLAAFPSTDPGLELDVVTPHHAKYYNGELETASDTENPVPVFFPAVKSQADTDSCFNFPLIPLARATEADIQQARRWLGHGLELLGLGAKANAGYGWFKDITDDVQAEMLKASELASAQADSTISDKLRAMSKDQLRGILNKFEFEKEMFWPQQQPESTSTFQLTLLELHLEDAALLAEALAVKKAKKALLNLARKFNRPLP